MNTTGYTQIANRLWTQIRAGDPPPGQPLPTEDQLAKAYAVNRTTARRALDQLQDWGAAVPGRHAGPRRVRDDHPLPVSILAGRPGGDAFLDTASAAGLRPAETIIGAATGHADAYPDIAKTLGIGTGTLAARRTLLRTTGHPPEPNSYETTWFPGWLLAQAPRLADAADIAGGSVAYLLHQLTRDDPELQVAEDHTITARPPNPEDTILGVHPGTSLIIQTRTGSIPMPGEPSVWRPIYYAAIHWPADRAILAWQTIHPADPYPLPIPRDHPAEHGIQDNPATHGHGYGCDK